MQLSDRKHTGGTDMHQSTYSINNKTHYDIDTQLLHRSINYTSDNIIVLYYFLLDAP